MTTITTSLDAARMPARALRAALVALTVVALLTAAFIVGRVSAPSTSVPPVQTHVHAPAVSTGGGNTSADCPPGTHRVVAC
jgi:hypothetical protein